MTRSTEILREEHHWVRLLLDCLERLVEGFRETGGFDSKAAAELQALFEHFVDATHQEKEEAGLFPTLLECVQRLQVDHAQEREHLDRMRFELFNAVLGDPASREEFARDARAYVDLQRQHMERENLGLLPLADQLLTREDDEAVLEEFRRRDSDGPPAEEVRARVREVCERLSVPFVEVGVVVGVDAGAPAAAHSA